MAANLNLLKFLFLLFFSSLGSSHAQYIKPGDTLSSFTGPLLDSQGPLLDSPNGRFNLYFMPWANYTYLGVLLYISNDTLSSIWYSSQGIPSANRSAEFILENKDGALRIRRQGGIPITLCYSFATNKTIATLLDSGNFVFNEVYSNGSTKRVLWQSFDHLKDVLIPGMKLGVNHKTGQNWSLTSPLTSDIQIPGAFTLEWDPKGHELVIKHRGVVHWKSGVLRDNQFENIAPHLTSMYDFNVVSNGDEESVSLKYKNQSLPQKWVLSPTGQLMEHSINGSVLTAGADNCYGYNTEGGCQRWSQSDCRHNGDKVDFKSGSFTDIDYFLHPRYYSTPDTNLAISDCKVSCLNNCSCVAFYYLYENATGCKFWTNISTFLADDSSRSEHLYIITPEPSNSVNPNNIKPEPSNSANPNHITPKPSQSGKSRWIWIGIVIAIAFVTFS